MSDFVCAALVPIKADNHIVLLPTSVARQFDKLQDMLNAECSGHAENLSHCTNALAELRELYRHLHYFVLRDKVDTGRVWRWSSALDSEYLQLVKHKHQPALVVLAHFAAANALARDIWFVNDWSEYAVRGISMELDLSLIHI